MLPSPCCVGDLQNDDRGIRIPKYYRANHMPNANIYYKFDDLPHLALYGAINSRSQGIAFSIE